MTETLSLSNAISFLIEHAKKNGADAAESFGINSTTISAECRQQKTETLEYAEGSVPTPHGKIYVEWHKENGEVKLGVKLPDGVKLVD